MINKQNLWMITLLSLIVVLCIYYVSLPDKSNISMVSNISNLSDVVEINEADVLIALKVEEEERMLDELETAQQLLLNDSSTISQKNDAYKTIQSLNIKKSQMNKIESLLKSNYSLNSVVKINGNTINIIVSGKDQGVDTVNKIIKEVQSLYEEQKYITVKFQN